MSITEKQSQRLKEIQLEMLDFFISVCEKENLQYYLFYGSVLGAVRHNGFIPWDDDIDVGLPRKDYEKYIKVSSKYLPEYYFLQNIYTEKNFLGNYSKIRDTRTTFIEKPCKDIEMNHGVYIDVFPLDGYPSSKIVSTFLTCMKKFSGIPITQAFNSSKKQNFKFKVAVKILSLFSLDEKKALIKREKIFKSFDYEKSSLVINHSGAYGQKEIMRKENFGKGTVAEFEGRKVLIPEKYDKYLSDLYGDYMTLPPVESRIGHHSTETIDLDNSFMKYM